MREKSGINCHSTTTATFGRICPEDAVGDDRRGVVHVGAAAVAAGILFKDASGRRHRAVDLESRCAPIVSGGVAAVGAEVAVLNPSALGRHGAVVVAVTRDDGAVGDDATRHIERPADVRPAVLSVPASVECQIADGGLGVEEIHAPCVV